MSNRFRQGTGPPAWFIFLLAAAFVFGVYYLWTNFRSFVSSGGLSVAQATQLSQQLTTVTAERAVRAQAQLPTRRPTATPKPPCQDFEVAAESAILRREASTLSGLIEALSEGTVVCVLQSVDGDDGFLWYLIDRDPVTRLIEVAYMREDVIRPLNPTPTPSDTAPPPPTVTPTYTPTASHTPLSPPTGTPNPNASRTPTYTPIPSETPASVNL